MRQVGWTIIEPDGELRRGTTGTYHNKTRRAPPKIYATKPIAKSIARDDAKVVRVFIEEDQ